MLLGAFLYKCLFEHLFFSFFVVYLGVEFLGHLEILYLILRNCQTVFLQLRHFTLLSAGHKRLWFLHIFTNTHYFHLFIYYDSHLSGYEAASHCTSLCFCGEKMLSSCLEHYFQSLQFTKKLQKLICFVVASFWNTWLTISNLFVWIICLEQA